MPVVQRHAFAAVDGGTDKATALVDEGRGSARSAGSARNVTSTIVEVLRFLLGVRCCLRRTSDTSTLMNVKDLGQTVSEAVPQSL